MPEIKLTDYIAKRLKEFGIDRIFMITGGGAIHLNDSFAKKFNILFNHNEQATAFSAEGYSRTNGKLAVVNVTTGPGSLNCMNGLFGQWTDSVPVLYISGQVKSSTCLNSCPQLNLRQLGDQETDIIKSVKHLTKYAVTVNDKYSIKYHLERAIYEATTGRKGPVWLNIPMDIQNENVIEEELSGFILPDEIISVSPDIIQSVVSNINKAKKPVIIAGHGIKLSESENDFMEFINIIKAPVVMTFNGGDILNTDNSLNVGKVGTIGTRAGNFAIQNSDLIISLGSRNNIRQISYNYENFGKNAFKISVDIDNAELDKPTFKPDLKVNCDLKYFLYCLNKELKSSFNNDFSEYLKFCQTLKEKFNLQFEHKQTSKINPYYFTKALTSVLKKGDTLVSANATASITMFQFGEYNGQRVIMNSGNASMGYALPAAIGAFYETKGATVCLEGDGSIMMNIQELQTIKHNKIPLKIFILNNNGYSSIRQTQNNLFNGVHTGSDSNSGISMPDFCKVADAFGIKSIKLLNHYDIKTVIENVMSYEEPVVCEVITDENCDFAPKLSSKIDADGKIISPSIENMYPFLSEQIYKQCIL